MARVKIDLPDNFIFSTDIKVRISDINYGGHVGNDAVLSFAHEARVQFLNFLGYEELNIEGTSLIMADSAIVYKGESFFGDNLKIEVGVQDITRLGFDLIYRITNTKTNSEIAHIKTGMVCFDYEKRKVTALPEAAKTKLIG